MALGERLGQKHGFWPRCTGRATEWSPELRIRSAKRLFWNHRRSKQAHSHASCKLNAKPARKLRSGRSKSRFRREPDFADAPESAQNGGFRRLFAAARVADFPHSSRGPRPKASFASKGRLRNAVTHACRFAPQEGPFLGLGTGRNGHHSARAGALDAPKSAPKTRNQLVPKHPGTRPL